VHVMRRGDYVELRSDALEKRERLPYSRDSGSIYDVAAQHRQAQGLELSLSQKLALLENIDVDSVRLDASGGDVLCVSENYQFLRAASAKLGRSNVTLTATGAGLVGRHPKDIAPYVSEYNFTFDSASLADVANRPKGYARRNLDAGRQFADLGCTTRAEFPIARSTLSEDHLSRLYRVLHAAHIEKLLLMRLFPVGRGADFHQEILRPDEYRRAISILRGLELQYGSPKLRLQCALRHLETPIINDGAAGVENPCDMVRESFGLTPDGTLLVSPWAINRRGQPIDSALILGSLLHERLSTILASDRVRVLQDRANHNFGHCKIFAFLNSSLPDPIDRLTDSADPLYAGMSGQSATVAAE
jgi:MoaA/NifB/PqqE/SkfB family radical SAM enzyme